MHHFFVVTRRLKFIPSQNKKYTLIIRTVFELTYEPRVKIVDCFSGRLNEMQTVLLQARQSENLNKCNTMRKEKSPHLKSFL